MRFSRFIGWSRPWSDHLLGPFLALLCALPGWADGGGYEPFAKIERGTSGLSEMHLSVRNLGAGEMSCTAQLAHWHASALGRVAPGDTVKAVLWHDPEAGGLSLLNEGGDRMPVEAVRCGAVSAPNARPAHLPLPFGIGAQTGVARMSCRGEPLVCGAR